MAYVLRGDLRTMIRDAADMDADADGFASDDLLNRHIASSFAAHHAMVVRLLGADYVTTSATLSTVADTAYIDLPSDFWIMRAVSYLPAGATDPSGWRTMHEWSWEDRADDIKRQNDSEQQEYRYRLTGTHGSSGATPRAKMRVSPLPQSVWSIAIDYTPLSTHTSVTELGDVAYDGWVEGWHDWVVWDCAARLLAKEESDPSFALAQRGMVEQNIAALAGARDAHRTERIRDVRGTRLYGEPWWRGRVPR